MAKTMNVYSGTRLTLGSHCQYHKVILGKMVNVATEALHLKDIFETYKAAVDIEISVVKRQRSYMETIDLARADRRRDINLSIMSNVIKAQLKATDKTDYDIAVQLDNIMRPFYNIQSHEINRETTEIDKLISQLKGQEIHDMLDILGLGNTYMALLTTNADVKGYLEDRRTETEKRADINSINTVKQRREVDTIYRQVVAMVNANAIITPSEALTAFIDSANVTVAEYRLVAANQAKKKKKEPESE